MNLWVKSLRQLTIASVALFFFSCEDEAKFLGFPNPNNKFDARYVDIPLGINDVVAIDSLITDLRLIASGGSQPQYIDGIVAGQYQDPDFGKISAQPFLSVYPTANSALNSTAEFDSITIQLRLNFHAYGFTGTKELRFGVHEITGDTLSLYGGKRYYSSSDNPAYGVDPLGEAIVTVNRDYLLDEADSLSNAQDTIMLRGTLDYDYGRRVFEAIKAGFTTSTQVKEFKNNIKGVTLVPGTEEGILGMNVVNSFGQGSRIIIHYHTLTSGGAVDDTLSTSLGFEFSCFSKIQADRTGTELASATPYTPFDPGTGLRYIHSGAGLVTRLDLAPFYSFADTVDNIMITEAQLIVEDVVGSPGAEPHNALMLRLMDENSNQFLNSRVKADLERLRNYEFLSLNATNPYFFAASEDRPDGLAAILYDDENDRMSGYITLFAQSLFANKNDTDGINDQRLRYVALAPANLTYPNTSAGPSGDRRVTRTLFHKDNVKLRIFYTRAKTAIP